MNFVWLDINASWSHSSLALPALHAQLDSNTKKECNWQVVRGTIKSDIASIIEQTIQTQPTYIFATCWLFNNNYINEVLCRVNAICKPKGIFLGGPEFLGNNKGFLNARPYITAVFKGEGEEMFPAFVKSLLLDNNKWKEIPGWEYIENGLYHSSGEENVKDFANLNTPEQSELFSWDKSFVQLETSRGCFNSCKFCVSGISKAPVQDLPISSIKNRLDTIVSKGIKEVRILDRTFNANPKRAKEFIDLAATYKSKLKFHLEIHPALIRGEFKEVLETVPEDLLHVEAGIQSLQENVLLSCSRIGSNQKAIDGLKYLLSTNKFEVHADLIAGLPEYSYNQLVKDTISLMEIGPHEIQLESLKLLAGTFFRNNSESLDIEYSPTPPYEVLKTKDISYKEISKAMTLSKILDFWYNDSRWRNLFKKIICKENDLLEEMVCYLHGTEYITQPLSLESKGILLYRFCKEKAAHFLKDVALEWIKNGLSINKEPAEQFKQWHFKDSDIENPLFDKDNIRNKYYYLITESQIHWFIFNKEIERIAPIRYYIQEL